MPLVDLATGEPIHDNPMAAVVRIGMKLASLNESLIADAPRVLLVGQAPSRTSDPQSPFSGRSGARLVAYSGLDRSEFWRRVEGVNLLDYWPGRSRPKGDDFSLPEARAAVQALVAKVNGRRPHYRRLLLAGRKVAQAFDIERFAWFEEFPWSAHMSYVLRVAVIPHPSGANYWWNQPANVELAQRKLREWI